MPLARTSESVGANSIAAASTVYADSIVMPIGISTTPFLVVADLPRLFFYVRQTSLAPGAILTVTPQFAVASISAGGPPAPNWLDLGLPIAVPVNVPVLLNYQIAAKFIRVSMSASAAGDTVEIVYGGTQ